MSRVNPVAHLPDGSRFLIWAANGGAPNHLDWYRNLMARGRTRASRSGARRRCLVAETTGEERERLFARAAERYPQLVELARSTEGVIPMIVLTPRG